MSDVTKVDFGALETIAAQLQSANQRFDQGFNEMTGELNRSMAEWGEDTSSRQAYNEFKARVDKCLAEMNGALAKMPPAVQQAKAAAEAAEAGNRALFQ